MKLFRSRSGLIFIAALLLLALFVLRPGANGLRKRIVNTVSLALGRKVEVQWVKLRILPQPGFDLENFVVYDDSAFSAEPMLRASEVTATLRLRSLLRGRLEIGRLSLKEPSFNLVRNLDGHWNLEALLDRAAHIPSAPTANLKPEAHPVFPYIEADNGRINFKIGQEKKSYALTDADFALWLDPDNKWSMRLLAQPIRTDFNLSDTGMVRVTGAWHRSEQLRGTPLNFTVRWERAQLGQFTKLLYGSDKGWRGALTLSTTLLGTPADLSVKTEATIQDFRRYDIVPADSLRLAATCAAHYSSVEHLLSEIVCQSPVGRGQFKLAGKIGAPTGPRSYNLGLVAQDIPVQAVVALARRAKKDLPSDLIASGTLNGSFSLRTTGMPGALEWSGSGKTEDFRLQSETSKTELALGSIPFVLTPAIDPRHNRAQRFFKNHAVVMSEAHMDIGPFPVVLGKSAVTSLQGWISRSGYSFSAVGDAQIKRALLIAQLLGLRAPEPAADGLARIELHLSGAWTGFAPPRVDGTAELRAARAELRGLDGPLQITSANLSLSESGVRVQNLSADAAGSHWSGSLSFPRACVSFATCPLQFDLQADTLAVDQLQNWLNPGPRQRPWYRFLSSGSQPGSSLLLTLNASGTLRAKEVVTKRFTAHAIAATVDLQDGRVRLSDLTADLLGGSHRGDWEANFRATPPTYSGAGELQRVSLAQLAEAMHDGWITGTASARYRFVSSGNTLNNFLSSATGSLQFDAREATLPHIALASGNAPLRVRRFTGNLGLHDGAFELKEGKLETAGVLYLVSGTASLEQALDIKFSRLGARGFNVTGTLSAPKVLPATAVETQAALKP